MAIQQATQHYLRRKRAIYTGLHPFLDKNQLMEALILWETKYAHQATFSVRYYVADLIKQLDSDIQSRHLLVNLVSTMGGTDATLLADPSDLLSRYKKQHNIAERSDFSLPELEAFQILMNKWLTLIPPTARTDVSKFVSRNLNELDIVTTLIPQVQEWLSNNNYRMKMSQVSVSDLRKIINLFYVGFCEYLGPVDADKLLAETLCKLKSNGGAAYSPLFYRLL